MKKEKGFTLIELLAVIVILAIIALIATPIVLNIIQDSKKSATLQSAEFYLGAVENALGKKMLDGTKIEDGTYSLMQDGNLCLELDGEKCKRGFIEVEVSGSTPSEGNIIIKNTKLNDLNLIIDNQKIIKNNDKLVLDSRLCNYENGYTWDFDYSKKEEIFTVPCFGEYKLEVWGAQGGSYSVIKGGYGGYSVGYIELKKNETLYINVGGMGVAYGTHVNLDGGYNGGGSAIIDSDSNVRTSSGGGATHIAEVTGLLSELAEKKSNILIVSGGGGGYGFNGAYSISDAIGFSGGGFEGNGKPEASGVWTNTPGGGTQELGGTYYSSNCNGKYCSNGSFGLGGSGHYAGAGGGFYGGGVCWGTGAGGSGYIQNERLFNKHMTCYECKVSDNTQTKTTQTKNASDKAVSDYAKIGNGYARITLTS